MEKGWQDRDYMMLHACFQLLKDCVEKEGLLAHSEGYAKSKHGKIAKELYDWWELRKAENFTDSDDQYEIDTKQLLRLVKIRGGLWT